MDVNSLSSNWKKLQEKLKTDNVPASPKKRKITTTSSSDPSEARNGVNKKKRMSEGASVSDLKQVRKYRDRPASWKPHRMSEARRVSAAGHPATTEKDAAVVTTITTTTTTTTKSRRNSTVSVHRVEPSRNGTVNEGRSPTAEVGKYIAMDCEMVGVGPNPDSDSALARVSIVNFNGDQVYDSYVRPKEMVTDWRTHVSGISPKHMLEARSLEQVQKDVAEILDGRVLVGHAVSNDLDALLFSHPKRDIRDTSKHAPYRKVAGGGSPRLKILAAEFLGLTIQEGAHSSVEDARATMMLYRRDKEAFEREHAKKWPVRVTVDSKEKGDGDQKKKKKKKKTRKR